MGGIEKLINIVLIVFISILLLVSFIAIGVSAGALGNDKLPNMGNTLNVDKYYHVKLMLGCSVVVAVICIAHIVVMALYIIEKIPLLIWFIVNSICFLLYLILFSVLCHNVTTYLEGADLARSMCAFSGLAWIWTLGGLVCMLIAAGANNDSKEKAAEGAGKEGAEASAGTQSQNPSKASNPSQNASKVSNPSTHSNSRKASAQSQGRKPSAQPGGQARKPSGPPTKPPQKPPTRPPSRPATAGRQTPKSQGRK